VTNKPMSKDDWRALIANTNLAATLKGAGFNEKRIEYLVEETALNLDWRHRQLLFGPTA
jgi:hypothetical protein